MWALLVGRPIAYCPDMLHVCICKYRPCRPHRSALSGATCSVLTTLLFLFMTVGAIAAQYGGQKIDGMRYLGFVRSLDTGKYYPARLVFEQNFVSVLLESGKKLDLMLDQEGIEDPEEILATDSHGLGWALSVDGIELPQTKSLLSQSTQPFGAPAGAPVS